MRSGRLLIFALAPLALLSSTAAVAGTLRTQIQVRAVVLAACQVRTEALDFGAYDPRGANASGALDGSGTIVLNCTQGIQPRIEILPGRFGGEVAGTSRAMSNGRDRLDYEIFKDADRMDVWGMGGNALVVPTRLLAGPQEIPVYGRIPGGQDVAAGPYADVAVVQIEF